MGCKTTRYLLRLAHETVRLIVWRTVLKERVSVFIPTVLMRARLPHMQPPGLAQQLRLPPKLLRQTLRYFESEEQLVRREHRQEKANRRKRPGDIVHDAGALSTLAPPHPQDHLAHGPNDSS